MIEVFKYPYLMDNNLSIYCDNQAYLETHKMSAHILRDFREPPVHNIVVFLFNSIASFVNKD